MQSATRNKKYTSLEDWADVLSIPDSTFVSLQYGECEAELDAIERKTGHKILRWDDVDLKNDLEAVFGIMANLDLVISTSNAVLPMAGALGRPTVFVGHRSWIFLGQEDVYPWFRSVKPVFADSGSSLGMVAPDVMHCVKSLLENNA